MQIRHKKIGFSKELSVRDGGSKSSTIRLAKEREKFKATFKAKDSVTLYEQTCELCNVIRPNNSLNFGKDKKGNTKKVCRMCEGT